MSNVLLIDADSSIPNIPLMKISTYHLQKNDKIFLIKLNLPYYPNKKKKYYFAPKWFDKIYCSVIFEGNKKYIKGDNIIFGGTGVDLCTNLPEDIEKCELDYSLYPENNYSYGFITRGCIRNCWFCKVPEKEGMIHKVADIDSIVRHKKVKFLDNNILAYPKHKDILNELICKKIKCQFNQGLDIRLVDEENSILLSKLNYLGEYFFSFDDYKYKDIIENKMSLLTWRKDWQIKFFVYVHPSMKLSDTIERILWLKKNKCLVYIMRDISCWNDKNYEIFTDLASWCNQVHLFKTLNFSTFIEKRHTNKNRINKDKQLWRQNSHGIE